MRSMVLTGLVFALTAMTPADIRRPVVLRAMPPEIPQGYEWINSKPLQLDGLKGKVVVLHFWTFG